MASAIAFFTVVILYKLYLYLWKEATGGDSSGMSETGETAHRYAQAAGAGLLKGRKTKNVTSCDNVFLTNILLASTPSIRQEATLSNQSM